MSDPWGVQAAPAAAASDPWGVTTVAKTVAKKIDKTENKVGKAVDKTVGGAIVAGHKNPWSVAMGALGAPQRALQAAELGQFGDIGKDFMQPKTEKRLAQQVKEKIGLTGLERGALAGHDLPHKAARGVLDTGLDIVNDPLTFVPVGKAARLAGKVVPKLAEGADKLANAARDSGVGKFLDPEADLHALTDKGKATYEAIINKGKEAADAVGKTQEEVVKRYAGAIRSGEIPDDVKALFASKKNIPEAAVGMRPQDVNAALYKERAAIRQKTVHSLLQGQGLTAPGARSVGRAKVTLKDPGAMFNDPTQMAETQAALAKLVNKRAPAPSGWTSIAKALTHAGNKAFLALPFPHGGNLTNLAYNRYGLPTTLKGLGNAVRVSTNTVGKDSHLGQNIDQLKAMGANSQYGNIFDELGLTGTKWIPGSRVAAKVANAGLIPLQKGSNLLQNKFLNPLETGLRAAALDAEAKGGTRGVEAARNIHKAFGSGASNKLTQTAESTGAQFAKFHGQTSLGSGLRTLATNPARVLNAGKADRDLNAQINPGTSPKFHMSVPGANTLRAIGDPLHYGTPLLGPIADIGSTYSSLPNVEKGKVSKAIGAVIAKYGPGSEEASILMNILLSKRGRAGEKAANDLPGLITGGYYQKAPK